MTNLIPNRIHAATINQMVDVTRFEAGLRLEIRKMLDQLGKGLVQDLLVSNLDTPRTSWQQARLRELAKVAQARITETYGLVDATMGEQMQGLIEIGSKGIVTAINGAIGAKLLAPIQWTPEMLAKLAGNTLIQGAPSAEWWSRQADGLGEAFADEMRMGTLRGETITQLRDRIMGQNIPGVNAAGKVDLRTVAKADRGLIWTARRNAEALVRTSVFAVNNEAHFAAMQANADIMAGFAWCATLDNRTCVRCARLDQLRWDLQNKPIGHDIPYPGMPLHWNDRCFPLPVTKSWEQLAQEAGGNTKLARELDKIPAGDRASMGGPVSGDLTYEQWFDRQPEPRQMEILGPGRLSLYKKGQLGFTDMVNQNGNSLTLKELAAKAGGVPTTSVGTRDLAHWMAHPSENLPVALLPGRLQNALGTKAESVLFSPETLVKQLKNHPELRAEDYARLLGKLDEAEVYRDGEFKVAMVMMEDRAYRIAMKAVQDRSEVFLTSLHALRDRTLGQVRKLERIY